MPLAWLPVLCALKVAAAAAAARRLITEADFEAQWRWVLAEF